MKKIKITEQDLHKIVMESVNNILTEMQWQTYDSAAEKSQKLSDKATNAYERKRRANQAEAFRKKANEVCDTQYGVDKIKQKKLDYRRNGGDGEYEPSNGELKRLQRQSDDVFNYYSGNQEYKDGKWRNK